MVKKTVRGVCLLIFVGACAFPAFADQSIGFQEYFKEGVKAFKEHDDQKAVRCFKIAQIYDPQSKDLNNYLFILKQRGVILQLYPSGLPAEQTIGYRYYFSGGVEAFQVHNDKKAIRYFKIALIFNPASKESIRYLNVLYQRQGLSVYPEKSLPAAQVGQASSLQPYLPSVGPPPSAIVSKPAPSMAVPPQQETAMTPAAAPLAGQAVIPSSQPQPSTVYQPAAAITNPAIYVAVKKAKAPPTVLSLAQLTNNGQSKLQIELNSSVIIEGQNIKRFLVVDEGYIGVKEIDADHLEVNAIAMGATFLHIWDDFGRHTLYIEVVFPKSVITPAMIQDMQGIKHSQPFTVNYSNDWDTYYTGKNIPAIKRESNDFYQTLGVTGETPYGLFDTSASYSDFDSFSQINTYTVGLSQIPLEGTSNFNLRGFDALRYLSPLTLPGTTLRGISADVDLLGDNLGLSFSNGKEEETEDFSGPGENQQWHSYINALQLTLFPRSQTDQYSFNYATAQNSPNRPSYLADHVYSVEGQHMFNDFLTLNAEQATDTNHDAQLASLNWQQGDFKTGLDFKNIDKNYSTVSYIPAYQGNTGAAWTTEADFKKFSETTYLEAYQDHLDSNPNNPSALNYDADGHFHLNITKDVWSDSDINYQNNAGEFSPSDSLGLNERIARDFGIWNSLSGTFFAGAGYQNSHASESNTSDYDRESVITGIQLPLSHQVSFNSDYEYDWLDQPDSGGNSNPKIINVGLEYQKQINPKLSFNSQVDYHDEMGVRPGSFLSGEQSVIITSGFSYNPFPDISIFGDANASKVISHIGNLPYDDFEIHFGMRLVFGGVTYWDPLGTVSGIVFKDRIGDGKFVQGDEGIPGVKLKVGDKETVTDQYGRYSIKIRAKGVDVSPVLDTVPGGLLFSTPQRLAVKIFQGRVSHADFGLISQTGIYGIVFVDKNGSGIPGDNDIFIGKVNIILDGKITQKSDLHGAFYFRKVTPGEHIISIDINSLALNMVPTVKLKNKIDVAEGTNYMFNVPVQVKQAEIEQK